MERHEVQFGLIRLQGAFSAFYRAISKSNLSAILSPSNQSIDIIGLIRHRRHVGRQLVE